MALSEAQVALAIGWTLARTVTGFEDATQEGSTAWSMSPDATDYPSTLVAKYTVAASGSQTIDLRSFTDLAGDPRTANTKLVGLAFVSDGLPGATCRIQPGDTDPIVWCFRGTTPAIEIPSGGVIAIFSPTHSVVSATERNLEITNPGTASLNVTVFGILG